MEAGDPSDESSSDDGAPVVREVGPSSSLEDLIRFAVATSPGLQAAHRTVLANLQRVTQAESLPDPTLSASVAIVPVETRTGPQRGRISLSQTIPGRGKRPARADVARAAASAAERDHDRRGRLLALQVSNAYYELYLLMRAIEITRDNRDILVFLEEAVRKAYETGKAPYADLIRSQVEIGKLENELQSLDDQQNTARERLNALLHRPVGSLLPTPWLPEDRPVLLPEERLRRDMLEASPDLAVLDAEIVQEEERVRLSQLGGRPDWTLSLNYYPTDDAILPGTPDSGDDPVMAGVAVSLPVHRKRYRAEEQEAAERRRAVGERRLAQEDELRDRLVRALYNFRNGDREIGLYRDTLLPKAEQSFEASQAGVRTGTAGALDLVDAQRILLQFQLAFERALTERARAVAELRYLVGGEVLEP